MATIIIGRKELFSFAERHSSRHLTDYSGLADGAVLCCLFSLVFPDLRIRLAAPQTHSATQRAHLNWEQLYRRFAQLHIPLDLLQPAELQANNAECGFSTLVLFYFLHHLSKRADFSTEFALDVSEAVTSYLQSTDCIASLLMGHALAWSSIPASLVKTLQSHPGFQQSAEAAAAAQEAAAALYRSRFTRQGRRRTGSSSATAAAASRTSSSADSRCCDVGGFKGQKPTTTATAAVSTAAARDLTCTRTQDKAMRVQGRPALTATATPSSSRSSHTGQLHASSHSSGRDSEVISESDRGVSGRDSERSPAPRAPSQGPSARVAHPRQHQQQQQHLLKSVNRSSASSSARASSTASEMHEFDTSLEIGSEADNENSSLDVARRLAPDEEDQRPSRSTSSSTQSASSSYAEVAVSSAPASRAHDQSTRQHLRPQQQRQSTNASFKSDVPPAHTAYRAAPSVTRPGSASSSSTTAAEALHGSASTRETALEAALQAKESECESLQMRVAQLLSLLANVKTTAMAGTSSPASPPRPAHEPPASESAQRLQHYAQRIEELEAQLHVQDAQAPAKSPQQDLQEEISALTADVVDEETGTRIDVMERANLLHCLLLEHLQDSPRNREQMQQWLWGIVAAHHTIEGRLLAAVELLRTFASHSTGRTATARSPSTTTAAAAAAATSSQPRSQSTVAAPFLSARSPQAASLSPPAKQPLFLSSHVTEVSRAAADLAQLRGDFYAELGLLHTREHELAAALHTAQDARTATVQRAVRRERLWKRLCAAVYAAEQASFRMVDCETTEEVEACLQERDHHYNEVESLTQELVEDSPETKDAENKEEMGDRGHRAAADVEEKGEHAACASLQVLVSHLEEEREELLRDVSRLHDLLAAMKRERQSETSRSPPATPGPHLRSGSSNSSSSGTAGVLREKTDRPSQLPVPPTFRPLFYPTAFTTEADKTHTSPTRSFPISSSSFTSPPAQDSGLRSGDARPPRGLSDLLRERVMTHGVW